MEKRRTPRSSKKSSAYYRRDGRRFSQVSHTHKWPLHKYYAVCCSTKDALHYIFHSPAPQAQIRIMRALFATSAAKNSFLRRLDGKDIKTTRDTFKN